MRHVVGYVVSQRAFSVVFAVAFSFAVVVAGPFFAIPLARRRRCRRLRGDLRLPRHRCLRLPRRRRRRPSLRPFAVVAFAILFAVTCDRVLTNVPPREAFASLLNRRHRHLAKRLTRKTPPPRERCELTPHGKPGILSRHRLLSPALEYTTFSIATISKRHSEKSLILRCLLINVATLKLLLRLQAFLNQVTISLSLFGKQKWKALFA